MLGMRLFPAILFLTLVGSLSHGAPHEETGRPSFSSEDSSSHAPSVDIEKTESVQMSGPSGTEESPVISSFKVSWKSRSNERLQVHAGLLAGDLIEKNKQESSPFVGLLYLRKFDPQTAWDISTDFAARSWFRLNGGKRFYVGTDRGHRPYLRVGASQTVPFDGFPSQALSFETMKVSGGVGFGNLFDENENWSAQFDLQWGSLGGALQFTLGWNFDL